jgi:transcriptional regulator with XRE-family HTH domain
MAPTGKLSKMGNTFMTDTLLTHIGETIRSIRKRQGLSIEDVAYMADIHSTYLSLIERGQRNLSVKLLCNIAVALGATATSLLPGSQPGKAKDTYTEHTLQLLSGLSARHKQIILHTIKVLARQLEKTTAIWK